MNTLKPGQVYEITDAYIGRIKNYLHELIYIDQLKNNFENVRKNKCIQKVKRVLRTQKKSKRLTSMNIYVTNTPSLST